MKRILTILFSISLLTATVYLPIGCGTTREAKTYFTLKDSWTLAHGAYQGWVERVVAKKVSKENEVKVDKLWNDFRAAYRVAVRTAQFNTSAPADVNLINLQTDLVELIRQLSL